MKIHEGQKVDERLIEDIKKSIKAMGKQFDDSLFKKVNVSEYEKMVKKMQEKLGLFFNMNSDKSNKSEVKKMFTFLEDKIKDIIIVLSEEKHLNLDGALKKIPPKCLSCDKDLDPMGGSEPQTIYGHRSTRSSMNLNSTARSSTGHLRKRTRLNKENVD